MDEIHPTRLRIFQAIEQIIRELGVEAVTFPEVSRRVFLQPSSIVYYFPTKDDMLAEFIQWQLKESEILADGPSGSVQEDAGRICALVDLFADATPYRDPVMRSIVRFILNDSDRSGRSLFMQNHIIESAERTILTSFSQLRSSPAAAPERWDAALAEFYVFVVGQQIMGYFDIFPTGQPAARQAVAERTKRALLKDGLYSEQEKGADC